MNNVKYPQPPTQVMIDNTKAIQNARWDKQQQAQDKYNAAYKAMSTKKAIALYNNKGNYPMFMHLDANKTADMAKQVIEDAIFSHCKTKTRAMGRGGIANWLWSANTINRPLLEFACEWDRLCLESGNSEWETN